MPGWRERRERGSSMVYIALPTPLEVVTGRLLEAGAETVTMEDDAGQTRQVARGRAFRATPDQLMRLRALQVTDQLLREQLAALLAELERI
ncbi:MAG TPA: hypothetical protein VNM66_02555 [Thermodesulfobacteriota bacterium]|nr:hypothetical protein [Thermodesulfobacteriota bacterium]